MKQLPFKRITSTVIRIIIWAVCIKMLAGMGVTPLLAVIILLMLKSIFRIIFRLSVILVSIAMFVLFLSLLCCI
ncbi:MAG: hypothetical protein LBE79_12710 [Tannerella sp.]|nr:hypothetical protein [Tannerella sp.]